MLASVPKKQWPQNKHPTSNCCFLLPTFFPVPLKKAAVLAETGSDTPILGVSPQCTGISVMTCFSAIHSQVPFTMYR